MAAPAAPEAALGPPFVGAKAGASADVAVDDAAASRQIARWVATLLAVDPAGLGGVALRARAGPQRDAWLAQLRNALPAGTPLRRVPLNIQDDRLLGGLDLAATLQAGRPVAQRGVLSEADGGVVLLAMAERLAAGTAARLAAVLDTGQVLMERDGLGARAASRFAVVAFDEGVADDERTPQRLLERLAFHLALAPGRAQPEEVGALFDRHAEPHTAAGADADLDAMTRADVLAARALLPRVKAGDEIVEALCAAGLALGIASVRAPMLALRAACAAAALAGRTEVEADDAALAARLVLAPRATQLPADAPPDEEDASDESEPPPADNEAGDDPVPPAEADTPDTPDAGATDPPADNPIEPDAAAKTETGAVDDMVLEAALAAIPAGLLDALKLGQGQRSRTESAGRAGASQQGKLRGRPSGVRRGEPRAGVRLNLLETLRAAAPWQAVRRREMAVKAGAQPIARIQVRREDFHVTHFKQRSETTTVFVVDASGSSALNRLAEAKGAVELLLADCYVRRDSVAVIAFRGRAAELLLPPTRSLVRAKRSLAGLPGGGGTPLAAGIDAAAALADAVRRKGGTPVVVMLTDGRANIARDGAPGRARANEEAMVAARQFHAAGFSALLLDTSPQPQEPARELARQLGATYLPLPYAGAPVLSHVVKAAGSRAGRG